MLSSSLSSTPSCNPNPNPHLPMQANHFFHLLTGIIHRNRLATDRVPKIRRAAYVSMACAAGPRRAWTRALLRRIRRRARVRALTARRVRRVQAPPRPKGRWATTSRTEELRRIVPGGRGMDVCSLLEETGNYIQHLRAQVLIMRSIADSLNV